MKMFSLRITFVAIAFAAILTHQDEQAVRWSLNKTSEISEKINKRESEPERRQREITFLKAAYDRLQADLDEDPSRSGAVSIRQEQGVILQMMRDRTQPSAAVASSLSGSTAEQAAASVPVQATARDAQATALMPRVAAGDAIESSPESEAPVAVAPIPPRALSQTQTTAPAATD
jgi:hypothetical protein